MDHPNMGHQHLISPTSVIMPVSGLYTAHSSQTPSYQNSTSSSMVVNVGGNPNVISSQYMNSPSVNVSNLTIPMTPLGGRPTFSDHLGHRHSSFESTTLQSIQSVQPITPGSVIDIPLPQLQNIVSTVNLGVPLDLKSIALRARNAEYNPKRFAAVIMRIRDPRTTALIFSSGKMVCTGAKSEDASRLASRKYARIVQKLGFEAKFTEFKCWISEVTHTN